MSGWDLIVTKQRAVASVVDTVLSLSEIYFKFSKGRKHGKDKTN